MKKRTPPKGLVRKLKLRARLRTKVLCRRYGVSHMYVNRLAMYIKAGRI